MKVCKSCSIEKPIGDFVIDSRRKDGHGSHCKLCHSMRSSKNRSEKRKENPERFIAKDASDYARRASKPGFADNNRARAKTWRDENNDRFLMAMEKWRKENRTAILEKKRLDYLSNREKHISRVKTYRANNIHKSRLWQRIHQSRRRSAHVSWANHEKINKIYAQAQLATLETGVEHHVDHYYPLCGKLVCGLHVENNLVITTAKLNQEKGNRMPAD